MANYEYARFGAGFVRRDTDNLPTDGTSGWVSCAADDVPESFTAAEKMVSIRRDSILAGGGEFFVCRGRDRRAAGRCCQRISR